MINLLFICLFFLATDANAEWQDKATLEQVMESFARSHTADLPGKVEIGYGKLDPRLRLPRCPQPTAFIPTGSRLWGNTTLGLRCVSPAWTVYAPVTVKVMAPIAVTARPLPKGQLIGPNDVVMRSSDLTQLPGGILTDPKLALGTRLTSSLPADYPLRSDMLQATLVLIPGQKVKLLVQGPGFKVNTEGTVMSSAAAGQTVNVRTASGKIVSGIAKSDGTVEVPN